MNFLLRMPLAGFTSDPRQITYVTAFGPKCRRWWQIPEPGSRAPRAGAALLPLATYPSLDPPQRQQRHVAQAAEAQVEQLDKAALHSRRSQRTAVAVRAPRAEL